MKMEDTVEFSINVVGEKTGERWMGKFSCRRRLSHRQELAKDRLYRELLGPNPEGASERAKSQADVMADISACIVKAPNWWTEAGNRP